MVHLLYAGAVSACFELDSDSVYYAKEPYAVYLNGEYIGVYLLCEQIEVQKTRVNIKESTWVDTGYLIEMDGRGDGTGFHANFKFYAIKTPDPDLPTFTPEHKAFIKDYLEQCFEALKSDDFSEVENLMDVRSFAQAYVVYELFNCVDVGYASFYLHKDQGGPLRCGPVWDFDRSLGIVGNTHGAKDYDALKAGEKIELVDIRKAVEGDGKVTVRAGGRTFTATTSLSDREKTLILAGGLLASLR